MRKKSVKDINYKVVKIIDLKEPHLYKKEHIKGSINIPYDKLMNNYKKLLNKNETYYLTCSEGHLSKRATSILEYLGYDVIMLEKD